MRIFACAAVCSLLSLFVTGCGNSGGEAEPKAEVTGRVAIVDLDDVAKQLGRDIQMTNSLKEQQGTLVEKLKEAELSYAKQINDKKAEFVQPAGYTEPAGAAQGNQNTGAGFRENDTFRDPNVTPVQATEELTEEENRLLVGMVRQANLKLNQVRQSASAALNQHRTQLVSGFRQEVKPTALAVAKEHGLSVVLTKNDSVLFAHEDAVDITDEVVARMRNGK